MWAAIATGDISACLELGPRAIRKMLRNILMVQAKLKTLVTLGRDWQNCLVYPNLYARK